jgi:hypothetical protein
MEGAAGAAGSACGDTKKEEEEDEEEEDEDEEEEDEDEEEEDELVGEKNVYSRGWRSHADAG